MKCNGDNVNQESIQKEICFIHSLIESNFDQWKKFDFELLRSMYKDVCTSTGILYTTFRLRNIKGLVMK